MSEHYTLEAGEYVYRVTCECCGKKKKRVWGFVSKHDDAHAIYYALLNVEDEHPRVGLTLSVGPWWEGTAASERSWVHLQVWSANDGIQMSIREPQESNFYPWEKGGKPLNRDEALGSKVIDEIWSVADFLVKSDPALSSYLEGDGVNAAGREERDVSDTAKACS